MNANFSCCLWKKTWLRLIRYIKNQTSNCRHSVANYCCKFLNLFHSGITWNWHFKRKLKNKWVFWPLRLKNLEKISLKKFALFFVYLSWHISMTSYNLLVWKSYIFTNQSAFQERCYIGFKIYLLQSNKTTVG